MADLADVIATVNANPGERALFQSDPVGYLQGKGISLPPGAMQQIADQVKAYAAQNPVWNVGCMVGPKA